MAQKKIPERMCIGCQGLFPKKDLMRIVRSPAGAYSVDATGKMAGRGAYVCRKRECFDRAWKGHRLERSFHGQVEPALYRELEMAMFRGEHDG